MAPLKKIKMLASDSLIYGLSGVISKFIGIFLTPLYTRVYSPADYGVLGILNNGYFFVTIILILSLDNSTARWFYDTDDSTDRKKTINTWLWFYLSVSVIIGLLFFLISDYLGAYFFQGYEEAGLLIKLLSVSLPLMVWVSVANNVLRFERKVVSTVILTICQSLLIIGLNILFVLKMKLGLKGAFYAQTLSAAIIMPLAIYMIRHWIGTPSLFEIKRLRQMIRYSLPFVPATLAFWIVNLSGVFFINAFLTKDQAGLFQIGVSIATVAGLITNAFQQAWSPFAFSILNYSDAKITYARVLHVYVLVVGFLCMSISVFTPEALYLLATPKYYGAAWVASILSFSYLFIGLTSIAGLGSSVAKRTAPLGFISVISAILLVIFNFILIPLMGKEGAALAICLAQVITPVYMFYRSQQLYFIPYDFKKSIIIIIAIIALSVIGRLITLNNVMVLLMLKCLLLVIMMVVVYWASKKEFHKLLLLFQNRDGK